MIRPRKIDGYILSEIINPLFGGVIFFTFVFLMFQILRLAEFFIVHGVPGPVLIKMIFLLALSFLPTALPVAFLIAVLTTFGRLSSDSELIAMKSTGISLWRLSFPVTFLSLIVVVLSLALNLDWVPKGERLFKTLLVKVGNTKVVSSLKAGTFSDDFFDLLFFAEKVDTKTKTMERIFIYDEREAKTPTAVVAQQGRIIPVKPPSALGAAIILQLENGNIHRNDSGTESYQKINFDKYSLFLEVDEGKDTSAIKPKYFPYKSLLDEIKKHPKTSYTSREFRAELWRRYTIACSPLIFVFLGIGFGTVRTRSARAGAALVALVVLLIYWALFTFAITLAQNGKIQPEIAMHIPNFIMLIVAVYGFKKSAW